MTTEKCLYCKKPIPSTGLVDEGGYSIIQEVIGKKGKIHKAHISCAVVE